MIFEKGVHVRIVEVPTEDMYNVKVTTSKFLSMHLCQVLSRMIKARLMVGYRDGSIGEVTATAKGGYFTEVRFGSEVMHLPSICLMPKDDITFKKAQNVRLSRWVANEMSPKLEGEADLYNTKIRKAKLMVGVNGSAGIVDWMFGDGFLYVIFSNSANLRLPQECFDPV